MDTNEPNSNVDVVDVDPKADTVESQEKLADKFIFTKLGLYVGLVAMLFFPLGGALSNGIVGALCAGGGSALGTAVGSFLEALSEKPQPDLSSAASRLGPFSLFLGLVSLVAWFIPIAGLPIAIVGFVTGRRSRHSSHRRIALTGMGLSTVGLVLSSINGYLGALMAVKNSIANS